MCAAPWGWMSVSDWRCIPRRISVGDYVLTGGELPALVMIDAAGPIGPLACSVMRRRRPKSLYRGALEYPALHEAGRRARERAVPCIMYVCTYMCMSVTRGIMRRSVASAGRQQLQIPSQATGPVTGS